MSKKRRVFQVAREFSLPNEVVIGFLAKLDKSVHTQMSAVSDDLYDEICKKYKVDESAVETPQDFGKQLKEKQVLEELRRNKARMELEERLRFATKLAEEKPERTKKAAAAKKAKEEAVALKREKEKKVEVVEETPESTPEEISVVELISKAKKEIDKKNAAAEKDGKKSSKKKFDKETGENKEAQEKDNKKKQIETNEIPPRPQPKHIKKVEVFLSYARVDANMMVRIQKKLKNANISVWTDEALKPGTVSWKKAIEKAIEEVNCIVVMFSPDAKNSKWVGAELDYAEIQNKPIYPLLTRGDNKTSIPFSYTLMQWIDVRKNANLDAGIKKLINTIHERFEPRPKKE